MVRTSLNRRSGQDIHRPVQKVRQLRCHADKLYPGHTSRLELNEHVNVTFRIEIVTKYRAEQ